MTPGPFKRFIAVDWSGAKQGYAKKLTVAMCETGEEAPRLITKPGGWSRAAIADFICSQPRGTLTGFDFSFAPPFIDRGAFLTGDDLPTTGPDFWAYVDDVAAGDPDCGALSFIHGAHRGQFYLGKADGAKVDFQRWRVCEEVFNAKGGGKADSVFTMIGAAQVGKASFAGMRALQRINGKVPIWPFQAAEPGGSLVTEIYCRAFIRHAGLRGLKIRDADTLNTALTALGSDIYSGDGALNDDQTDVLVTSAGLRWLSANRDAWHPAGLSDKVAQTEGWTYGVF